MRISLARQARPSIAATTPRRMRPRRAPARLLRRRWRDHRQQARLPCNKVACTSAPTAPPRGDPRAATRLRVEQRMSEQGSARPLRPPRRSRRLSCLQPALCFRGELRCRTEVHPIGVQRIARIAVRDTRAAEHSTQPAHDHRHLRRRVAGLLVEPEHIREALDAHRPPLGDAEHAKRKTCLLAPELVLCYAFNTEPVDDAHPQRVRRRRRARRRGGLGADHGTKNTCRRSAPALVSWRELRTCRSCSRRSSRSPQPAHRRSPRRHVRRAAR